jgi:hypothetical protein
MQDCVGTKESHAINFIITDISHYDMILSMAFLQKINSDIYQDTYKGLAIQVQD